MNVLMTGGLALFHVAGIWFAVKEASFPLLLGLFILLSAYGKTPFFTYLVQQVPWLKHEISRLHTEGVRSEKLSRLLMQSTFLFSCSFFISALLNFILALYVFSPTEGLESVARGTQLLNQQIADMTWIGFVVIGLPLTVFAGWILWRFLKQLSQITGKPLPEILENIQKTIIWH